MAFGGLFEHIMVYTKCMRGKEALRLGLYVCPRRRDWPLTECILHSDDFKFVKFNLNFNFNFFSFFFWNYLKGGG